MPSEAINVAQDEQLHNDLLTVLEHADNWQVTRTVGKPTAIKHSVSVIASLYRAGFNPKQALAAMQADKAKRVATCQRCDSEHMKREFERAEQAQKRAATLLEAINETLPMLHGETRLAALELRQILETL